MRIWSIGLRAWLIHKLGGYTAEEATPNKNIHMLVMLHRYKLDMHKLYPMCVHSNHKDDAVDKFLKGIKSHIATQLYKDPKTDEWVLKLAFNVVDNVIL